MRALDRPWIKGIFSGIFAALILIAGGLIVRAVFGVGTIAELASDRIAPFTGIPLFFKLLNTFGGYSHLKELGITSVLCSELAGGAIVGLLYARLLRTHIAVRARAITAAVVAFLLILAIAALWPNLRTNYNGLSPAKALLASVATFTVLTALFVIALFWAALLLMATHHDSREGFDRRRALILGGAAAITAAVSAGLLGYFYKIASYHYDGTENAGDDLPPITPNDKFYQVTKNNVDPRPSLTAWALEIGGAVAQPAVLHMSDLQAMPNLVQETTLQCISNSIGGGLNSNAKWRGVPLRDLVLKSGPVDGAKQIMFHGADGFIDDLPFEKAMHPQTLVVFEMNGQPMPKRHGYPVRLIVPGYVGEKSVKWLTKVEVRKEPGKGFYEEQGWGPQFTINNSSRFDSTFDDPLKVGQRLVIKGTAFAGDRGVRRVEVSTDSERTWSPAEITYRGSDLAWVQWRFPWQPTAVGETTLTVRCVDGHGEVQSGEIKNSGPEPARGYHQVKVMVEA